MIGVSSSSSIPSGMLEAPSATNSSCDTETGIAWGVPFTPESSSDIRRASVARRGRGTQAARPMSVLSTRYAHVRRQGGSLTGSPVPLPLESMPRIMGRLLLLGLLLASSAGSASADSTKERAAILSIDLGKGVGDFV